MGFGDVKLGLMLGLFTGWLAGNLPQAAYLGVIAMFFGGLIGVIMGFVVALSRGARPRSRSGRPCAPARTSWCCCRTASSAENPPERAMAHRYH